MELSLGVTLAVIGAGFLHASWNALLKSSAGGDALLDTTAVAAGSSLWGLVFVGLVPLPVLDAWPYIAASLVIHFGYYVTLSQAYRTGDLSFAYPLMRGTAPLLVTILGAIVLRELPSAQMAVGIALISLGIVSIAFVQRRAHPRAAAYWAFANACIIAAYTLVDGAGARASGNAISYVTWLTFLEGIPFVVWVIVRRGRPALAYLRGSVRIGLVGGGCSLAAYGIVLWAMTRAPIAAVAALRETSVLFAALLGALWLKEGFGWRRLAGAASVVAGIAALKLG
ncbi:MAG TPA: EamA family transporter [Casimicrobiaceae bacterium]|nr:EamA family transporter [Casimicrobiaceae bacterium]